ncbi:6-bladed beta-propeller, partial [Bacteroides fragilis]|nr:6-bladed beta-propeller [Bacteroides fragilis]
VKLDTSPSDFVRLEDNNYVYSRSGEVDSLAGIYLVDAMGKFTSKLIARDDKYLFNNFSYNWELSVFDGIVGFMAPCLENRVYH